MSKDQNLLPKHILRIAFLSVLFSGKCPKIPGTIGSFVSVLLGLPILYYSINTFFLLAVLIGLIAIREITIWENYTQKHDEKWIVIDELVGVWIAMALASLSFGIHIIGIASAFVLFRIFDVWKPSIIGRIDRQVPGGLGVVGDDFVAGILAGIASLLVIQGCITLGIPLNLYMDTFGMQ